MQRLDDTKLYIQLIFQNRIENFVLSLHYNGSNSFLFVNATKIYQFKAKDSEVKKISLAISNYFRRCFNQ